MDETNRQSVRRADSSTAKRIDRLVEVDFLYQGAERTVMRALPLVVALVMLIAPVAGAVAPGATGASDVTPDADALQTDADANTDADENTDTNDHDGSDTDDATGPSAIEPAAIGEAGETFRVLSTPPDADPRTGIHGHEANLGTALDWEVGDVDTALETEAIVRHIENAETEEQRQRRILAAINEVEQDEVSLNSRQTAAINAHAAGELSDRELLGELATIGITAREYDERLDVLDELADETDDFSSPSRLDELQVQLQVYEGPVRDHALATVRGETGGSDVHVETSAGAVVLATIQGDQYVREAFRTDRWNRAGGTIGSEEAINVTAESYPETAALREADAFGAGSVQRITIAHDDGELRTFVSGGSDRVFVEHQRIDLDAFPDTEPVSTTADGFNATVDRSYPGGPVQVTVVDDEDGDPEIDVTVTMSVAGGDSEAIGTTDDDGVVWTLSPADEYRVTVVDEPRVAVIDGIEPIETPRVVDESPDDPDDGDGDENDGGDGDGTADDST